MADSSEYLMISQHGKLIRCSPPSKIMFALLVFSGHQGYINILSHCGRYEGMPPISSDFLNIIFNIGVQNSYHFTDRIS